MILTQGIAAIEGIPWKTIVVVLTLTAIALAITDTAIRSFQARERNKWLELSFGLTKDMHDMQGGIREAVDSLNEAVLSSVQFSNYPNRRTEDAS
jgi:hypothetical protein